MPRSEAIPADEARDIEFEIKKQIAGAGSNVSDVVRRLNEKYGTNDAAPNVTRQLKQGTLPVWKQNRIADVLGYEIVWKKKFGYRQKQADEIILMDLLNDKYDTLHKLGFEIVRIRKQGE